MSGGNGDGPHGGFLPVGTGYTFGTFQSNCWRRDVAPPTSRWHDSQHGTAHQIQWSQPMTTASLRRCLIALLLAGFVGCGGESETPRQTAESKPPDQEEKEAIAAMEELGATIESLGPGGGINVSFTNKTPTDAALVRLKRLTNLEWLSLGDTNVTDAELVHVEGLTNLTNLYLYDTKITDAGLVHLKGLTSLKILDLGGSKVTDEGVEALQTALPNCTIVG
jgi:hypothetical protein